MSARIIVADVLDGLASLEPESVQVCVTSPPYWGLRDYGVAGQLGLERTPQEYVDRMVAVFAAVRGVLRKDGTLWLNLGDCYNAYNGGSGPGSGPVDGPSERSAQRPQLATGYGLRDRGLKPKDLVGIPWRVALALQADGWWLRSDIIWSKPNPMPESVTDRCTKAHEYIFLLSKSARYYYDAEAIKEPAIYSGITGMDGSGFKDPQSFNGKHKTAAMFGARKSIDGEDSGTRNKRSVWEIATAPFPEAHFATFPPALIEPCIKAGTSEKGCCAKCGAPWVRQTDGASYYKGDDGDRSRKTNLVGNGHGGSGRGPKDNLGASISKTIGWSPACSCATADADGEPFPLGQCIVLDPFGGAGTTGLVADRLKRNAILIELNPEYAAMAERRIRNDAGMFADVSGQHQDNNASCLSLSGSVGDR
jgi:DNA modification methylase